MPNFGISVDEFLSTCNNTDIKDIIKALTEDNHLIGFSPKTGKFDVDSLYNDLTLPQIEQFVKILKEKELLVDMLIVDTTNISEYFFEKELMKLHGKWNSLSHDEEEIIKKIASRF